mmetsp:Transcript_21259/g.49313  ORF Transcript_21259/g.49313 Transcript_21259/m.49313 type:complete len:230 (-) Transcript_21259:51-740(-)
MGAACATTCRPRPEGRMIAEGSTAMCDGDIDSGRGGLPPPSFAGAAVGPAEPLGPLAARARSSGFVDGSGISEAAHGARARCGTAAGAAGPRFLPGDGSRAGCLLVGAMTSPCAKRLGLCLAGGRGSTFLRLDTDLGRCVGWILAYDAVCSDGEEKALRGNLASETPTLGCSSSVPMGKAWNRNASKSCLDSKTAGGVLARSFAPTAAGRPPATGAAILAGLLAGGRCH